MNHIAKLILIYTIIILIAAFGVGLWRYFTSYQYLVLQVPEDRQDYVTLYEAEPGDGSYIKHEDRRVGNLEFNTDLRLDKGFYVAEYNQEGFDISTREINLDSEIVNINFDYSIARPALDVILEDSLIEIHNSIEQSYPGMLSQYTFRQEKLYTDGTWYGAILDNNDDASLSRDTVRIVLRNEAGNWNIAAKPYITISNMEYPEIPEEVLVDINVIPPTNVFFQ